MNKSQTRIAIPIWNDYVSNVLDFANQLLLVDVEDNRDMQHTQLPLMPRVVSQRARQLVELDVDVLICGTISRSLGILLLTSHIEVIPFVTGPVNEVLDAYLNKQLDQAKFLQPGCNLRTRRHFCQEYECHHRRRRARARKGRASELQGEEPHHRHSSRPDTVTD